MGQYDKYPVRNASGYVEYLTAQEIENLREMGELGDVLSNQPSKAPPIARNPANQASINEMWAKQQEEKRQKRGGRRRGEGAGKIVRGVVSAGFAAGALGGAVSHPQQQSGTTQQHYGQARLNEERDRRGSQASNATRDKGFRDRGSSQR